jgi:hypothetical protein
MNALKSVLVTLFLVCLTSLSALAADLGVVKSGIGTGITGKTLDGEATTFKVGDKVYGLFLITNPGAPEPAKIVWKHGDKVRGSLDVTIGTSKTGWKTFGQHKLHKKAVGSWTCELLGNDGSVIASAAFTVE